MSFSQMLVLIAVPTLILAVFLAIYVVINNRTLKEESRHTREILNRIEQGQKETAAAMAEARKEMAEALSTWPN